MTEGEWLAADDPLPMLDFLNTAGRTNDRKLRLFAVGCSRRVWETIDDLGRAAVQAAEQFAEGRTGEDVLRAARLACRAAGGRAMWYAAASSAAVAARNAALAAHSEGGAAERAAQAELLRDLIGNPFRPVMRGERWLTRSVVELAMAIDETGAFEQVPALAGRLKTAGCDNDSLIAHCGQNGPHARGCWALDVILGRS